MLIIFLGTSLVFKIILLVTIRVFMASVQVDMSMGILKCVSMLIRALRLLSLGLILFVLHVRMRCTTIDEIF